MNFSSEQPIYVVDKFFQNIFERRREYCESLSLSFF